MAGNQQELPERLAPLRDRPFVGRMKVAPVMTAPPRPEDPKPTARNELTPEEWHRCMEFAEEFGLMTREPNAKQKQGKRRPCPARVELPRAWVLPRAPGPGQRQAAHRSQS